MRRTPATPAQPLVSVVVAAYNAQRYLAAAMQSILEQDYGRLELILVDDGSSDRTLGIARRFGRLDSRVKVLSQTNQGCSAARNSAIQAATGLYVAIMDADDISTRDRLATQVRYLDEHPDCVSVGSAYTMACPEGVPWWDEHPPLEHAAIVQGLLRGLGGSMMNATTLMRTEALADIGGYNPRYSYGEDVDLFLRLALRGRLANLPSVHLLYRQHLKSAVYTCNEQQQILMKEIITRAHAAHGLPLPDPFPPVTAARPPDPALWYRKCAANALRHGERLISARHLLRAMRHSPADLENFRFLRRFVRAPHA